MTSGQHVTFFPSSFFVFFFSFYFPRVPLGLKHVEPQGLRSKIQGNGERLFMGPCRGGQDPPETDSGCTARFYGEDVMMASAGIFVIEYRLARINGEVLNTG